MRVAILGNGVSGALLYHLLRGKSHIEVDLYGKEWNTNCGIRPCAWGVNYLEFTLFCKKIGIEAENYILNRKKYFYINGMKRECNIAMINKPLLLHDFGNGEAKLKEPNLDVYDRVVDATGKCMGGNTRYTMQKVVEEEMELSSYVSLLPVPTCKWNFPLGERTHVGIFSIGKIKYDDFSNGAICSCRSTFSVGMVKDLVQGKVWKVGESAGIIDPITGSGVLPALLSAKLLLENWNNQRNYKDAINLHFGYMRNRFRALFHNKYRGIPIDMVGLFWGALGWR